MGSLQRTMSDANSITKPIVFDTKPHKGENNKYLVTKELIEILNSHLEGQNTTIGTLTLKATHTEVVNAMRFLRTAKIICDPPSPPSMKNTKTELLEVIEMLTGMLKKHNIKPFPDAATPSEQRGGAAG